MLKDFDSSRDRGASYEYLDLLAFVLAEHEKNLDSLIERLRKAVDGLEKQTKFKMSERILEAEKETSQMTDVEDPPKTIAYIKLIKY